MLEQEPTAALLLPGGDAGISAGTLLSSFPKAKCSSQHFPFEVQTPQSEPQTSREKGSGHESLGVWG